MDRHPGAGFVARRPADDVSGTVNLCDDDEVLVRLFAETGDQQAFTALVERHLPAIRRMLRGVLAGDDQEVQDVEQELLVALFAGLPAFRFGSSFRTYLYRVARNKAIDALRRRERELRALNRWQAGRSGEEPGDPEQRLIENEERKRLHTRAMRVLAELDPDERALILLREVEELSLKEISRTLRVRLGTVKSRLHRIRTKIERMVEDDH